MELISFYVPYNFKKGHPKFAGLELLLENFKRQAADLKKYVDDETERINKEIKAEEKTLIESVTWYYSLVEKLPTTDTDEPRIFAIEMIPYIGGMAVTETHLLNIIGIRSGTRRNSAWFSVINNVMIVHSTGSYWQFDAVKNGRVLTSQEACDIANGVLPESLKQY